VENALRDFRLGGADLPVEKKQRYAEIQEELAKLSARFSENVLDATNAFGIVVDEGHTAGIPADVLHAAREAAQKDAKPGFKFTLHAPSYMPVMQYAQDRALRETLYRESATRASEFGKPEWDNTSLIARIVQLRGELARLLGYRNFAEVSLEPKMAETPQQVLAFLDDLARHARPFAEQDVLQLKEFSSSKLNIADLQAWDVAFASEKLRQERYAFSDQEVKQYFPEDAVLAGLFRVAESLYQVRIVPAQAPVWHQDVRFFEIRDAAGSRVGQFYMDLYARDTKRGGAWMDDAITRRRKGAEIQTPVAHLNCNFSRPVGGKPALFTHDEVLTLFHEFGHGLHHLLTEIALPSIGGIDGVEWDAVELPSQFMENVAWRPEVLADMARHHETGEPLPADKQARLLGSRTFQAGLATMRQLEFALFDFRLHAEYEPARGPRVDEILASVRAEVAVFAVPEWNRFPHNFAHIFSGGYAAGYYSYKWAEVLAADAFSAFEERGVFDRAVAQRFLDSILSQGGSRKALDAFVDFRGRPPDVKALLRQQGLDS
jgi:oligopeptidase A